MNHQSAIAWDTIGGVARRNWARNEHAIETAIEYNRLHQGTDHITIPYLTDEDLVKDLLRSCSNKKTCPPTSDLSWVSTWLKRKFHFIYFVTFNNNNTRYYLMAKIVECIPNFSEGRNQAVIDGLVETAKSVPGVTLLDHSSDAATIAASYLGR